MQDFQEILDGLRNGNGSVNVLNARFAEAPGGEVVDGLLADIRGRLEQGDLDRDTGVALAGRLDRMLKDLKTLPMAPGNARPSNEDLERVDGLIMNAKIFDRVAEKIIGMITDEGQASSVSGYFNAYHSHDPNRSEVIWQMMTEDIALAPMLDHIASILAKSIVAKEGATEDPKVLAMADLKALFSNLPTRHLNAKSEAYILANKLDGAVTRRIESRLIDFVWGGLPLVDGGERLENPDLFSRAVYLAQDFLAMDELVFLEMLDNPMGQAQTADMGKAESFFRAREGVEKEKIQNNFGFVYLTEVQFDAVPELGAYAKGIEFEYFGKPYYAVPMGAYLNYKDNERFSATMMGLEEMAQAYPGTPVADYYKLLLKYYELPVTAESVNDEAFIKEYHDVCYEAERAWVAYTRYAAEYKLPFIHIHPFEKYDMASTRSHDLPVGIVNHQETEAYLRAKDKFVANAKPFLEGRGVFEKYPKMAKETMRLIESAGILSLGARMGSESEGIIAQNIPNEEPGRKDGIGVLCDTAFAQKRLEAGHGNALKMADPLGGLAEDYGWRIRDFEIFMSHYIKEVLSHELTHNFYKGTEQVYESDGRGLAVKLVEEAKATNGLAVAFEDPYNLTNADIGRLREALPLMMPWSIFRPKKELRAEHTSHQYLREGMVMLDHALNSGLLEVVHAELDENGEPLVDSDKFDDWKGFEFLRYNLGEKQIRDYVARCADFEARLAAVYYHTQGFEGELPKGEVVPDITDIDAWQATSRECYLEERARIVLEKGVDHPDVMAIDLALEKLVPPQDDAMPYKVRALIRNANFEQPARMRAEVAAFYRLELNDPELDVKVAELQAKLRAQYPQIYWEGREL